MSTAAQNLNSNPAAHLVSDGLQTHAKAIDIMGWLACTLTVEVPVVHFTVADFLGLKEGSIVETACHHTSDVPLRANRMLIGWTEFEVVGDQLAIRVTEQI
jgi:flagellar motor switch/type III secretory pathway protein FliN